jgi:hypothetical protein
LQFFKLNRFSAYSADELIFELGMLGVTTTGELFAVELRELVSQRRLLTADCDAP